MATKKPLHDGLGGWKHKARACCCGNFEEGTTPGDWANRAEVPATFEMRVLMAIASTNEWTAGMLDISTAFLNAELEDAVDGVIIVRPPTDTGRLWSSCSRNLLEVG